MATDRRPEFFKGSQLRVGVIGCGYVGLPLGLRFAEAGHRVIGFDTDPAKVEKLNRGQTYIQHIPQNKIQQFVQSKHFGATSDFSRLAEMDAILICVPTPLDQRREPDLSYVEQTAQAIRPHLQRGQLVVLESTTYPGTTEELVLPILEQTGMKCPVAHGPENEQITGARRPRQQAVRPGADPESGGGSESALGTRGGGAVCANSRARGPGQLDSGGRNDEAAREYLPLREHRSGQRIEIAGVANGH